MSIDNSDGVSVDVFADDDTFRASAKRMVEKHHSALEKLEISSMSDLALIEACDARFGSLMLFGRGSVHLILEQLKSYVKEGVAGNGNDGMAADRDGTEGRLG